MNLRILITIFAAGLAASLSHGQSAQLTADAPAVASGAVLTLTASANYPAAPAAVGWSVTLPEGWTFVATGGPDAPQVGPQGGATGTLEWAYSDVPAGAARFSFTVKTAGKTGPVHLQAKMFLRIDGKLQTIEASPVGVSVAP